MTNLKRSMTFTGFTRLSLLIVLSLGSLILTAGAQSTNTNKLTIPKPASATNAPTKPKAPPVTKSAPTQKIKVVVPPTKTKPATTTPKPAPKPTPAPVKTTPKPSAKTDYFSTMLQLVDNKPIGFTPGATSSNLVIDPAKGAGGVSFDASMDDLIAVWGRPHAITMSTYDNEPLKASDITLHMGGSRFRFLNNRLIEISLHRSNLPSATFASGVGFDSTEADFISKLGKPRSKRTNMLEYQISKTNIRIQFSRHFKTGKTSPIAITLSRE
ncbi:hypothetical protein N9B94_01025 [Verrucomicrobia bacterium]|nr:hypothetical protein [Verrucomicrobiota bacterium]